MMAKQTTVT